MTFFIIFLLSISRGGGPGPLGPPPLGPPPHGHAPGYDHTHHTCSVIDILGRGHKIEVCPPPPPPGAIYPRYATE